MDITPIIPEGKNIIKGYGEMAFKINEDVYKNSLILFPDSVAKWEVTEAGDISIRSLEIVNSNGDVEILLIGCGDIHVPLDPEIHGYFSRHNIGVEIMTTGAACRTYNVLLAEGRSVAAALIAV